MFAADGTEILVWQVMTPIVRADGSIHQVSTVGRDVTERKRFESDLAHQATHDPLTGLPNRALLLDHLELELARAERESRLVALLFLDLDRFKQVNDTLGHDAGDELLAQAAQRISAVVRPADTVARMGGDEFVILCGDVDGPGPRPGRRPPRRGQHREPTLRHRRRRPDHHGQHRDRPVRRPRAPRGDPARRRRRHVPRQGPRSGPPRDLRREHAASDGPPPRALRGAGQRHRERRDRRALPAGRRPRLPAGSRASRRWPAGTTRRGA